MSTFESSQKLPKVLHYKTYLVNGVGCVLIYLIKMGEGLPSLGPTKDKLSAGHVGFECNAEGSWEPLIEAGKCSLWLQ